MHDITRNSMRTNGHIRRRARGARVITTISVALVLTVVGLVGLIGVVASGVGRMVRSELGLTVIVAEESTAEQLDSLTTRLQTAPYLESLTYTSAEEINAQMLAYVGEDQLLDINPFQAEYDVKVKPHWTSADSLEAIAAQLSPMGAVYEVAVHTKMVRSVNTTINTTMAILLAVAAVLLTISFALIFNLVTMEIYAQRLVIHTMQYVGAKRYHILRPYIKRSILMGIVAGIAASGIVVGLACWGSAVYPSLNRYLAPVEIAVMCGILIVAGAAISSLATWIAGARYVSRTYDEIFEN